MGWKFAYSTRSFSTDLKNKAQQRNPRLVKQAHNTNAQILMYQPRKDSAHTLGLGVGHGLKISSFHSLIFSRSEKQRATQNQWIVKRKIS